MGLGEIVKEAVVEEFKKIDIPMLKYYAINNHNAIAGLYSSGIIDDSSIESALEEGVFRQARKDYEAMTRKGREYVLYPDHVGRPEFFAHALEKGKFLREEIEKIPFDHGDNAETFVNNYRIENLLAKLRERLLNTESSSSREHVNSV